MAVTGRGTGEVGREPPKLLKWTNRGGVSDEPGDEPRLCNRGIAATGTSPEHLSCQPHGTSPIPRESTLTKGEFSEHSHRSHLLLLHC